MATIKSYTDINQSKKLAEILPLESADMHYWKRTWKENDYAISVGHSKELQEGFESKCIEYIPCWSLAALLDVLPENIKFKDNKYYLRFMKDYVEYANDVFSITGRCLHTTGNNLVDACYEMIIKLNEQKLL